jgi:hypothetical protein
MHYYTIPSKRRKVGASSRRSLRRHGPRYVHARRAKRLTAVWTLRPRHLIERVPR